MSTREQRRAALAELERIAIPLPAEQQDKPSLAQMIHCALVEYADRAAAVEQLRAQVERLGGSPVA